MLECGDPDGIPLVFIHGNFSSAVYFEDFMQTIPPGYRCLAVDLRGYGKTQDLPIDATRGARDWSDDLFALLRELEIPRAHCLGWSAGAAAIMQFALDYSTMVISLTLLAPVSPYGFGGSKTLTGEPCFGDFSGSGGGLVNAEFVRRVADGDQTTESPLSPRSVMRNTFVKPPLHFQREDTLLEGSLQQKTGNQRYPGDAPGSTNWPYKSPGLWGPLNAVSARYLDLSGLIDLQCKPPILWLRGDSDSVISDRSLSDPAVLGEMQLIPDWPGSQVYPAQPMLGQTRAMLNAYRKNGGRYREIVLPDVGHSPFLEKPDDVLFHLLEFLGQHA
ncbi:MAG: pimeloyl-ACP methyl ester carboxylesterase [Halioglobus sp.]|jgi:pimeloyl-ACP methyl ester carboxylesterase